MDIVKSYKDARLEYIEGYYYVDEHFFYNDSINGLFEICMHISYLLPSEQSFTGWYG